MIKLLMIGLYGAVTLMGCNNSSPEFSGGHSPSVSDSKSEVKKVLATMENDSVKLEDLEVATLGAGCFWCVEAVYEELKGVEKAVSGYSGGTVENPTYREVCYGTTGHAEVVNVYFDPKVVSFEDVLRVFFHTHNPTTLNRQGNDAGTQYRSAIFYHSEAQKQSAEKIIDEIQKSKLWNNEIVTEVTKFTSFYPAEDYHQEYYKLNGYAPYCQYVINPKMDKFRKEFKAKLKE